MNSGIYKIVNLITGMFYIGSAVDLIHRRNQHFSALSLNYHFNIHLQRSYNKYEKKSFLFVILEYCDKQNLLQREQHHLNLYWGKNLLYNISPLAGSNIGRKLREETKEKLSIINLGENNPRTHLNWEDIQKIRKEYFEDKKMEQLAKCYGVTKSCIQHIVFNINWYDPNYNPPKNNFGRSGERNGGAKLTKEQIMEIRNRYKNENIFQKDLAAEYGVCRATIMRIVNNKHWKKI